MHGTTSIVVRTDEQIIAVNVENDETLAVVALLLFAQSCMARVPGCVRWV